MVLAHHFLLKRKELAERVGVVLALHFLLKRKELAEQFLSLGFATTLAADSDRQEVASSERDGVFLAPRFLHKRKQLAELVL